MDNLKFEAGDFVTCDQHKQSFRAHIEKCPRPEDDHRVYMVRIYGGRGLTHVNEKDMTLLKSRRIPQEEVNYKRRK